MSFSRIFNAALRLTLTNLIVVSFCSVGSANTKYDFENEWSPEAVSKSVEPSSQSKSLEELTMDRWENESAQQLSEEDRLEQEIREAYELSKPLKAKKSRLAKAAKANRAKLKRN